MRALNASIPEAPDETMVALRDPFSETPEGSGYGPETPAGLLWVLRFLARRRAEFEIEVALEATTLEGEVAA